MSAPPTRVGSKSKSCKQPAGNVEKVPLQNQFNVLVAQKKKTEKMQESCSLKDITTLQDKVRQASNRSPDKFYLKLYHLDLERQLAPNGKVRS